jgi:hypothetical protein
MQTIVFIEILPLKMIVVSFFAPFPCEDMKLRVDINTCPASQHSQGRTETCGRPGAPYMLASQAAARLAGPLIWPWTQQNFLIICRCASLCSLNEKHVRDCHVCRSVGRVFLQQRYVRSHQCKNYLRRKITLNRISETTTYVLRREEHIWYVSVLQRAHFSKHEWFVEVSDLLLLSDRSNFSHPSVFTSV